MDWIEKNKEKTNMEILDEKIKETENEVKPILEVLASKINESNHHGSSSNFAGGNLSSRSKLITPYINK